MSAVSQERFWAQIPRAVLYHPELNGNDIRVYAALSDRAGRKDSAWPSHRTLADDLHISKTTVRDSIDRLVASGAIEVTTRRGSSNHYHLPFKEPGSETGTPTGSETDPTGSESGAGGSETDPELEELTRTNNKSARASVSDSEIWEVALELAEAAGGPNPRGLARVKAREDRDELIEEVLRRRSQAQQRADIAACGDCDARGFKDVDDNTVDYCDHQALRDAS